MADQTAEHILRTVDPERTVLGGGGPNWDAHGRTYRVLAQGLDVKKFNDAVPAAQQVGNGDDIEICDIGPWSMVLAYSVTVETTAGAACTADLLLGSSSNAIRNGINCNSAGTTRGGPAGTPVITSGSGAKMTLHFNAAPGNTKLTVYVLLVDMREEFSA